MQKPTNGRATEKVLIPIAEYESLQHDSMFLLALEAAGVDNWGEGYSVAWRACHDENGRPLKEMGELKW